MSQTPSPVNQIAAQNSYVLVQYVPDGAVSVALNRTSRDWHTRIVTLNEVKGLAVRFFATLRMTLPRGYGVKCTNVLNPDLEDSTLVLKASNALQERFETLLAKRKAGALSDEETREYQAICDLDTALSRLNRLARGSRNT